MIFTDARAAKEYLIATIAAAAVRAGQPLSENEVSMLRFSEIHGPLTAPDWPDDEEDWEARMAGMIKYARAGVKAAGRIDEWYEAVRVLRAEDHYLGWLLQRAGERPKYDLLKLVAIGAAIVSVILAALMALRYARWN